MNPYLRALLAIAIVSLGFGLLCIGIGTNLLEEELLAGDGADGTGLAGTGLAFAGGGVLTAMLWLTASAITWRPRTEAAADKSPAVRYEPTDRTPEFQ